MKASLDKIYIQNWARRLQERKVHFVEHLWMEVGTVEFEKILQSVIDEFPRQNIKKTLGGYFIKKLKEMSHPEYGSLYKLVFEMSGERERERKRISRRKRKRALRVA